METLTGSISFGGASPVDLGVYPGVAMGLQRAFRTLCAFYGGGHPHHVDDYYMGEWNDLEGDRINQNFNRFSGGSRVLVREVVPAWFSLLLGYGCLVGAILIGFYIYLQYQTDLRTLLLGGL